VSHSILTPEWSARSAVRAAFTLRSGGVSVAPYASLNVGEDVGDAPQAVQQNRQQICAELGLPGEPIWLRQVHGAGVLDLSQRQSTDEEPANRPEADAVFTRLPGQVCAVQVADCMPVLFAAGDGSAVAAAHAGWRGLAAGVLEATIARFSCAPRQLIAWLGPAIGPRHFEVGDEVRAAFVGHHPEAGAAFAVNASGRWQCDLALLVRQRLASAGLGSIFGGVWCTYADRERFFSYRRDGRCGRMAALIWLGR
jgi:polyphenol oxidase